MDRLESNRTAWRCPVRRLMAGLVAGIPLVGVACSGAALVSEYPDLPVPANVQQARPTPAKMIQTVQHVAPEGVQPREVPITLDAVFRLAEPTLTRDGEELVS